MSKTPQVIIDAVLAEQERKRSDLAAYQAEEKLAEQALLAATQKVTAVRNELDAIHEFLRQAQQPALMQPPKEATNVSTAAADAEPTEVDSTAFDGEGTIVSGRPLRKIVTASALEVAGEKKYFSVDDLMAKLKEKNVTLAVENPRIRASQVLTLTKGFVYDDARRAWTLSIEEVSAPKGANAE